MLVVGLGNPGRQYEQHRHNVGFMAIDAIASRFQAESFREKFNGFLAKARIGDVDAVLLKPMTFMNRSGQCVQPCAAFYKVSPENIIVIHDELDLPFGTVRMKVGGGHAGHNGLRSIVASLGTADFGRIRIGIGRPPKEFTGQVADYVLSSFSSMERQSLSICLNQVTDGVLDAASRGFSTAMNRFNTKPRSSAPAEGP